jgi:hypothetical protein
MGRDPMVDPPAVLSPIKFTKNIHCVGFLEKKPQGDLLIKII